MNPISAVTSVLNGVWKWFSVLREVKAHKQDVLTTRDLTARELKRNAAVVREDEVTFRSGDMSRLEFGEWDRSKTAWGAFRKHHEALWHEVADAYEALRLALVGRGDPPPSSELYDLAKRLQETEL